MPQTKPSALAQPKTLKEALAMQKKPSKYRAVPTVVDGICFDSKKEAARYGELKMLEKAGKIRQLKLQPWFVLMAPFMGARAVHDINDWVKSYRREVVGRYRADFSYWTQVGSADVFIVEDVKGKRTPLYRRSKCHFEAQYGVKILET